TLFRNPPAVKTIFVHLWNARERVYLRGGPDPNYRPDPLSNTTVRQLALATDGVAVGEHDYGRLVNQARGDPRRGAARLRGEGGAVRPRERAGARAGKGAAPLPPRAVRPRARVPAARLPVLAPEPLSRP